jgi:F420-dependent oxidoreductase-like protein
VRLGYQIPNFTYPGVGPAGLFPAVAAQARAAEGAGFDTVLVMDHFFQLPAMGPPDQEMLECYTLLAGLAGATSRVRLSALVTGNTYRNPAVLAKVVTALDVVSGGRAQLGIGAGWYQLEHDAFGIEFGTFTDRFEKLEESLQIVLPLLRGERVSFSGKHYTVADAVNSPLPVGRIPVMIGGGGERKTLRMAAQYADDANLIADRADVPRKLEALARHCAALNRDRRTITVTWQRSTCVAPTTEQAQQELLDGLARMGHDVSTASARDAAAARYLVGDPDTVGELLAADKALGLDGFTLNAPANGHVPERVALLGAVASKVVGGS